ncbi:MAG: cytochrome c [Planctomycetaceae bacterium]|nr:cytochrome c [Planctomycetaceae bacterium]
MVTSNTQSSSWSRIAWAIGAMSLIALGGCGGGSEPAPQQAGGTAPQQTTPMVTPAADINASVTPANPVDPNRKETKWIGKIPYDVFYDQPLTVAADSTLIGTQQASLSPNTPSPTGDAGPGEMPAPGEAAPAATTGGAETVDWKATMPLEMVLTEIKILRSQLQTNLQTVGAFNRAVADISNDGAILAALVGVVENHSEDASWKANAHIVRELAYQVYSSAEGSGRTAYEATQQPFEQLCVVMDGGSPPEIEAEPKAPFADFAYTSELMKWIDKRAIDLKANINTEDRLKEDPLAVERRMRMMAVFGSMMTLKGYESVDEKPYQEYMANFINGSLDGAKSSQTGNFDDFQAALNKIQTSCGECHQRYRGSDSGF